MQNNSSKQQSEMQAPNNSAAQVTLTINGKQVTVPEGSTVLQACLGAGYEIPRFCYHERLSIAGNCRMCLVEVSPSNGKPQASCALPASQGMQVNTNSDLVLKARRGVMEFLLINHPLDCPICDQGGECDLQDQAMRYGKSYSRFALDKRAVPDQYMGPLISTHMTRCIHCTRCVRFASEIAGVEALGMLRRGEQAIISSMEKAIFSELSGNLVDVCPVGALNSKPLSGSLRSWELTGVNSVDVHDALGSAIRLQSSGNAVRRILPRQHPELNEDWLSDKARYSLDGLARDRLDQPFISTNNQQQTASWEQALTAAAQALTATPAEKIAMLVGDLCGVEEIYSLRLLADSLSICNRDCRQYGEVLPAQPKFLSRLNLQLEQLEQADVILLVGVNPRLEAPLINTRLRRAWIAGAEIAVLGSENDLTYPYQYLGDQVSELADLANSKHKWAAKLAKAKLPLIMFGTDAVTRSDSLSIIEQLYQLSIKCGADGTKWMGLNYLHRAAARCGAMMVDFMPKQGGYSTSEIVAAAANGEIQCLYLLGCDEIDPAALTRARNAGCKIILQHHHGGKLADLADIILPGAAYSEKFAMYVNTQGRPQWGQQAVFPPGQAKEDWRIIRALSQFGNNPLPFDSHEALLEHLFREIPELAEINQAHPHEWAEFKTTRKKLHALPLSSSLSDYYTSNAIARASPTMLECSNVFAK